MQSCRCYIYGKKKTISVLISAFLGQFLPYKITNIQLYFVSFICITSVEANFRCVQIC